MAQNTEQNVFFFTRKKKIFLLNKTTKPSKEKEQNKKKKQFRTEKEKKRKSVTAKYRPVLRFLTHTKLLKVVSVVALQWNSQQGKMRNVTKAMKRCVCGSRKKSFVFVFLPHFTHNLPSSCALTTKLWMKISFFLSSSQEYLMLTFAVMLLCSI